ncbi:uncharacterized protein B0P05DRAFT_594115 [Gilbertella persicaria]|uniref:Mso1 N-terminal domain-containing protein n=1 Tax=Rhizopus stolonifer TaxID=4846 RepID=A0A367ILI6_RHIST|nr:uncharacterized protein B0P05DRAFT_594115 [Gilbertella persicaria]KAI8091375.1 hypothetical protein B0P05DRAFT_594115 [Gilbertella persicaria]RCH78540.1 hypothetical protein CU098_000050 [Rhizopus stolonifer]
MGAQVVDYRISTLVVLCKDCGNDVGLYPARHKCQPVGRPPMPPLPLQFMNTQEPAASPSPKPNATQIEPEEESVYFNNFAANLPETKEPAGKKLWGKIRENEKWKQLSEKNEKPKQSGKLWGKLIQATQNMADKIPSKDERGAESDEDDWEGETHVARIIREYYEKKRMRLPEWLFEDDPQTGITRKMSTRAPVDSQPDTISRNPSRRRLWDHDPMDPKNISSRERERQELRQVQDNRKSGRYQDDEESHYRREQCYNGRKDYEEEYRHSTRDYVEDRYAHKSPVRDHYPREPYTREQPRYYEDSSYRSPPPPQQQPYSKSRQYEDDDRYAQSPVRSPKQYSRSRQYEDSDHYSQPDSRLSGRSYNDYKSSHEPMVDYYPNNPRQHVPLAPMDRGASRYNQAPSPDMSRRPPSLRSGRRYGNDPNYF